MMWLMFIVYVVLQGGNASKYDVVMEKKYYASQEECGKAGQARVAALSADDKVAKIVAGTCLPSDAQQVKYRAPNKRQ